MTTANQDEHIRRLEAAVVQAALTFFTGPDATKEIHAKRLVQLHRATEALERAKRRPTNKAAGNGTTTS